MSIRHSLLAILDQGDCYGYQLRVEFERRTGGARQLNVGQVYATLDRLERDECVTRLGADATGHVYYAITRAGSAEVSAWFGTSSRDPDLDDLALKVALAQSLPGVDALAMVVRQRASSTTALDAMHSVVAPSGLSERLIAEARSRVAVARLSWLDEAAALLEDSRPFPLEAEPPRRGRPIRG